MHARVVLGVGKGVLFRCLERCPQFRGVLIEREREREVPLYIVYTLTNEKPYREVILPTLCVCTIN